MTTDADTPITGELVPMGDLPTPGGDEPGTRWALELGLVRQWLSELHGNTRKAYAAAIGWPYALDTGTFRPDAAEYRNGQTWLAWLARHRVHLLDAGREHVSAWADDLRTTPNPRTGRTLGQDTVAHTFTVASAFYKWAMQAGYAERNPVDLVNRRTLGVKKAKGDSPTRSLTEDEAGRLQAAADTYAGAELTRLSYSALVALILATGIRLDEALSLTLDKLTYSGGYRVLELMLKGGKPHRVPLPPETGRRVDAYLAARGIGRDTVVAVRGQHGGSALLFATKTGQKLDARNVRRMLVKLAELAGLEDPESVSPHALRHTHITELRALGVAGDAIQRHIGHQQAETTARYGHHVLDFARSPALLAASAFEAAAARHREGTG